MSRLVGQSGRWNSVGSPCRGRGLRGLGVGQTGRTEGSLVGWCCILEQSFKSSVGEGQIFRVYKYVCMHRCRRLQNVGADTACGCRIHALGHLGRPGGLPAQNAWVQCPKPVQCLAGTLCRTTPCRRLPKSGWTLKTRSGCSQPPKSYELARSLMIVQVCAIPTTHDRQKRLATLQDCNEGPGADPARLGHSCLLLQALLRRRERERSHASDEAPG